jgi:uncharacterized protein (DUF427 family)
MTKATWNGAVLAESDRTVTADGEVYFPPDSVNQAALKPSTAHTETPGKGTASYYNIDVNGKLNEDAAWYYPDPPPAARQLAGYVAFGKGVRVEQA